MLYLAPSKFPPWQFKPLTESNYVLKSTGSNVWKHLSGTSCLAEHSHWALNCEPKAYKHTPLPQMESNLQIPDTQPFQRRRAERGNCSLEFAEHSLYQQDYVHFSQWKWHGNLWMQGVLLACDVHSEVKSSERERGVLFSLLVLINTVSGVSVN